MSEAACADLRRRAALGEEQLDRGHLAACPGCRVEIAAIRSLFERLAERAAVRPPDSLDARARALIRRWRGVPHPGPPPLPLVVLGALWFVGLVTALSLVMAGTRVGPGAPALALILVLAYTVLSSVATLPVMFLRPSGRRSRPVEVPR
ncbi:MAG: hypothetical protein ACE5JH_01285 [Acidobacteriota bacterium]